MEISIVTFITGSEEFSNSLYDLIEVLQKESIEVKAYAYVDKYTESIQSSIKQIIYPQTTKYLRILHSLQHTEFNTILFVDNDITVDTGAILEFVKKFNQGNYALGWGRIGVSLHKGLVPRLVDIDKIISHNIIRPFLWKLNIGISVPGQIFLLNKRFFANCMQNKDTVYDDLAIGVIAKIHEFPYFSTSRCLGTEMPKADIVSLIRQRCRWAKGYSEIVLNNRRDSVLKYILIHGATYHLLLFMLWGLLLYVISIDTLMFSGLIFALLFCISWFDFKKLPFAGLYIIIFPMIHMAWLYKFCGFMIRGLRDQNMDSD